MATKIYANGTATVTVAAGEKIAVSSRNSAAQVYQKVGYPNYPDSFNLLSTVNGTEYLSAAFAVATDVRIDAGPDGAFYQTGAAPQIADPVADLTGIEDPFNITGLAAAQGGAVTVTGGTSSTTTNAGGAANVTGGTPGATGVGGAANVTAGAGGSTSGAGGVASVTGGAGTAGNSAGGVSRVVGGAGQGTATGGAAQVTGGASGAGATGTGGAAVVTGGASLATNGAGGAASVTGGAGAGTGAGGAAALTGGSSGAGATGNGGTASVVGGAAASTNGNGGNVILTPGALAGTGVAGMVVANGVVVSDQAAPNAQTTVVTLTAANLLTGIITGTHAAGADQAYTLPTGTLLDAAVQMAADEAFEWSLINLSAAAADTVTVTAGVDHTVVGVMVVQSAHATTGGLYGNAARFRTRKTAANVFVTYRIA